MREILAEYRSRLRDLVRPHRHQVDSLIIESRLGHSTFLAGNLAEMCDPKHWHDDEYLFTVKTTVAVADDYPVGEYSDDYSKKYYAEQINDVLKALEDVVEQVRADIPGWQEEIAKDEAYKLLVGKQVKSLRIDSCYKLVTGTGFQFKEQFVKVPVGNLGTVTGHKPGWLYIDFNDGNGSVRVGTWTFTTGSTRISDNVFVPNPYWKVV